jgi:serine/threonine protein kinase
MSAGQRLQARGKANIYVEVISTLQRGGFGEVAKVRWGYDGSLRAAKIGRPDKGTSAAAQLREAQALAQLPRHTNVVRYITAFAEQQFGALVIVMELADLGSAREYYAGIIAPDSDEVLKIGAQLAQGLAHAHALGLVHQDVSPANTLLFTGENQGVTAKLADFGLAGGTVDSSDRASAIMVGTCSVEGAPTTRVHGGHRWYRSPEQARGHMLSSKTDLWSLAATIRHLFAGSTTSEPPWGRGEHAATGLDADTISPLHVDIFRSILAAEPSSRPTAAVCTQQLRSLIKEAPTLEGGGKIPAPHGTHTYTASQASISAVPLPPCSKALVLHRHADLLQTQAGRRGDAIALYRQALDINPGDIGVQGSLALVLSEDASGETEAESLYRSILHVHPDHAGALYSLARMPTTSRQEAESLLRHALAVEPDDKQALNNLAVLLAREPTSRGEAELLYKHSLDLAPTNVGVMCNFATLLQRVPDRRAEAVTLYRRALELDQRHIGVLTNLACLLKKMGSHSEAEVLFRRALESGGPFAPALICLALSGLASILAPDKCRREEAETLFRRALELNPSSASALKGLAKILEYQGDQEKARTLRERAREGKGQKVSYTFSQGAGGSVSSGRVSRQLEIPAMSE